MIDKASRSFLLVLALTLVGASDTAARDGKPPVHAIFGGVLSHDVDDLWSGNRRESGVDVNAEVVLEPSLRVLGVEIRLAVGASVNTSGDTGKLFADGRLEHETRGGVFLAAGLGVAVHDGETESPVLERKSLGSRVLFHIPLEVGYRWDSGWSVSAYFDHVSNGYLGDPNEGMDTLGLRLGHAF